MIFKEIDNMEDVEAICHYANSSFEEIHSFYATIGKKYKNIGGRCPY